MDEEDKVRVGVYLSDVRQLQDVREDVEAWGLQQRADSLGQRWAGQGQELLHLHLTQGTHTRLESCTTAVRAAAGDTSMQQIQSRQSHLSCDLGWLSLYYGAVKNAIRGHWVIIFHKYSSNNHKDAASRSDHGVWNSDITLTEQYSSSSNG